MTFTATVAAVAPGATTPTGTVTFKDGSVILGTVAVGAGGKAPLTSSFVATGGHVVTAVYTGEYTDSPADLNAAPGPLMPNPARYIQVQFVLTTNNESSPKLKGFYIAFACESDVPD